MAKWWNGRESDSALLHVSYPTNDTVLISSWLYHILPGREDKLLLAQTVSGLPAYAATKNSVLDVNSKEAAVRMGHTMDTGSRVIPRPKTKRFDMPRLAQSHP